MGPVAIGNLKQIRIAWKRKAPATEKAKVPVGSSSGLLQCEMGNVKGVLNEPSSSISAAGTLSAIRGPSAVQIPVQIEAGGKLPLHEQISEQIRLLIADGKLRAGSYIPSSRQLADQLGVSRNTVLLAFSRLMSEGYIEATRGSHTYVSQAYTRFGP